MGIIKLLIGIILINYGKSYYLSLLNFLGLSFSSYSFLIQESLIVLFYLVVAFIVYLFYKDELKSDLRRFKRKSLPNILMIIVYFIVLTLVFKVASFLLGLVFTSLKEDNFMRFLPNLFKEKLDVSLILYILKNIILIPFIKVVIFILGVNDLIRGKRKGIIVSGLVGSISVGITLSGTLGNIIIECIPYFILYLSLALIYRENNSNVWFSYLTFILCNLFSLELLERFL